ncbi:MAG TPA: flagellar basal body rod protein FlgB [Rhodocyclaceae bacterium]|jgi:flagellar basal-body rod protein FlgB
MEPIQSSGVSSTGATGHGSHVSESGGSGQSFASALSQAQSQIPANGTGNQGSGLPQASSNGNASSTSRSHHIPLGNNPQGGHGFQETALGVRAYRQQLIASNIANADTPGYKAVDIDIQEALRIARGMMNTPGLDLSITDSAHFSGQAPNSAIPYPVKYHVPLQPSADGNTVEMDVERAKLAENSVMWEFSRDRVSGHFKMMMELFQNLK